MAPSLPPLHDGFTRVPASPYDSIGDEVRMLVHYGNVYSGRLSISKLEAAFYSLQERWPILAARLRRDQPAKPTEWYYDVPTEAKLQELRKAELARPSDIRSFCSNVIEGSVKSAWDFETAASLPQDRPSILTACEERELWASNAPNSLEDLLRNETPVVTMHVTRFDDATLLAICTPHVLCDGVGAREILRAFASILDGSGDEVKPLERQGEDLFASLSHKKEDPMPPRSNGMQTFSSLQMLRFAINFTRDLVRRPPADMQGKDVFVPSAYIQQLKDEATADLSTEGMGPDGKAKWVSSSDVLTAWILKNGLVARQKDTKSPFTVMFPANLRWLPPVEGVESIPEPYLHNLALNLTLPEMPVSHVTSLSLGALAYKIRTALIEQTQPEQIKASMRWRLANRGKLQLFFSPTSYWNVVSNWRRMDFFGLSLKSALQPGQDAPGAGNTVRLWSMASFPTPMRNGACLMGDDPAGGVWLGVLLSKKEWADPRGWGRFA